MPAASAEEALSDLKVPLNHVKLCRFELKTEPETVRSGMVFGGKIYETDGATAVGVYEADQVRPLSPIPYAPTLRIVRNDLQAQGDSERAVPAYYYGNPTSLVGTNSLISIPEFTRTLIARPYIAAVVVTPAYRIEVGLADEAILGLTIVTLLSAPIVEADESQRSLGFGRSGDIGGVIGPVLTTPDELDDFVVDEEFGRRYRLSASAKVNGLEQARGNIEDLPFSFAEVFAAVSQSGTLREGDIIAMGPIADEAEKIEMEPGDEFQISVENLGAIALKLSEDL